jgi:hypothetical protein
MGERGPLFRVFSRVWRLSSWSSPRIVPPARPAAQNNRTGFTTSAMMTVAPKTSRIAATT